MTVAISESSLRKLGERVTNEIPERFRYARVLSVLALNEEIGELLEEISRTQTETAVAPHIESELGDVLLSCFEIANAFALELTLPEAATAGSDLDTLALQVSIRAARVSKECLEIEGFDRPRHNELRESLNNLLAQVTALALFLGIDLESAFETKFRKILTRIEDGTWDRLYGNRLVAKRQKFD